MLQMARLEIRSRGHSSTRYRFLSRSVHVSRQLCLCKLVTCHVSTHTSGSSTNLLSQVAADLSPETNSRVGVQFTQFKIFGLLPITAPESAKGKLDTTFVDEELRISRGDKGHYCYLSHAHVCLRTFECEDLTHPKLDCKWQKLQNCRNFDSVQLLCR